VGDVEAGLEGDDDVGFGDQVVGKFGRRLVAHHNPGCSEGVMLVGASVAG